MKRSKKTLFKIILGLVITVCVGLVLCVLYHILLPLYIRGFMFLSVKKDLNKQVRLLSETNHQILLEACRQLSKRHERQELKSGTYNIGYDQDPKASNFPTIILNLKPSYVFIDDDGWIKLEIVGGLGHFGVIAYPEDYEKPAWSEDGDKELIPGLWYYDEGYKDNPKYRKRIDTLIEKGNAR